MDPTLLTNFGAAGVIAAMWLIERRAAAAHHRALHDAHERLLAERRDTAILIRLVKDSTRALTAVERTQRAVLDLLERLARSEPGASAPGTAVPPPPAPPPLHARPG